MSQAVSKGKLVKTSMIFAICLINIHNILKIISILGAIYIVIALPTRKNHQYYA